MIITETFYFLGIKSGKKKDGTDWNLVQTLDNDGKHFNFFYNDISRFKNFEKDSPFNLKFTLFYDLKSKKYQVNVKEVL